MAQDSGIEYLEDFALNIEGRVHFSDVSDYSVYMISTEFPLACSLTFPYSRKQKNSLDAFRSGDYSFLTLNTPNLRNFILYQWENGRKVLDLEFYGFDFKIRLPITSEERLFDMCHVLLAHPDYYDEDGTLDITREGEETICKFKLKNG